MVLDRHSAWGRPSARSSGTPAPAAGATPPPEAAAAPPAAPAGWPVMNRLEAASAMPPPAPAPATPLRPSSHSTARASSFLLLLDLLCRRLEYDAPSSPSSDDDGARTCAIGPGTGGAGGTAPAVPRGPPLISNPFEPPSTTGSNVRDRLPRLGKLSLDPLLCLLTDRSRIAGLMIAPPTSSVELGGTATMSSTRAAAPALFALFRRSPRLSLLLMLLRSPELLLALRRLQLSGSSSRKL
mmetsp:Transcript_27270/g.64785  ORF Transcript_27270/g.64785 Transcript_27270/m.64785 type:complete len:240 (-) Transcript_27270:1461-2180(-)